MVTDYRPHDHRWHKGLRMTASHLSGQNLRGGNTYVHGEGYLALPERVGSMAHAGFDEVSVDDIGARFTELTGIRTVAASGPRRRAGSRCATSTRRTAAGH